VLGDEKTVNLQHECDRQFQVVPNLNNGIKMFSISFDIYIESMPINVQKEFIE